MKLVTIDGREVAGRPGVLLDSGDILDLSSAPSSLTESQWIPHSVVSILAAGSAGLQTTQRIIDNVNALSDQARTELRKNNALRKPGDTVLMSPLRRPGLMVINLASAGKSPDLDPVYIKSPNTATGTAATVSLPGFAGNRVSVTPLLAVILGKSLHEADAAEAKKAIAAYTMILEFDHEGFGLDPAGSAIDWRRFVESKQVPGSCPMGPAMITVDEMPSVSGLQASVRVNGIESSAAAIMDDQRDVADVVAHLSQRYGFSAGDLVAFGSQVNQTLRTELQHGDTLEVTLDGLMSLQTTIGI
jgi:2-keto-4-pentenoate hydratase/2-oxohepta-3-ene-1,7-dioic acid hydratase in catechol pathway